MDEKTYQAMMQAVNAGIVVEIFKKPDGKIVIRSVKKKEIKVNK